MLDTLALAFVLTLGTALLVGVVGLLLAFAFYVADNWDDWSDHFKALGVFLLVFLAWTFVISVCKLAHKAPVKAEVEDVRAS